MKNIYLLLICCLLFSCRLYAQDCELSEEARQNWIRADFAIKNINSEDDWQYIVNEFENALQYTPNCPDIYFNLGLAYSELGVAKGIASFDKAEECFQKYLKLNPSADVKKQLLDIGIKKENYLKEHENTVFVVNGVSFEMVFVEGGTFVMGCTYEQKKQQNPNARNYPTHYVTLSDYYMGKYEVTQELWYAVTGTTIQQQRDIAMYRDYLFGEGNNYPMFFINYEECEQFCNKLNALLSNKLPQGYKFNLPTEAQWEYAARGGKKSNRCQFSGSNTLGEVAYIKTKYTQEVGMKYKNELGIYDMSGNISEWCQDWYGEYSDIATINPTGPPKSGGSRVLRGGNWNESPAYSDDINRFQVSYRYYTDPKVRNKDIGFRLCLVKN